MKKLTALVLTLSMIFLLAAVGGSAAFADDAAEKDAELAYLPGHWGEIEWIRNGDNNPFYLDETVANVSWVEFTMTVPVTPRGYPYGDWYLYTLDKDGKTWGHVAKFALTKEMTQGTPVTIRLTLDQPTTFKAITISPVESGMDFTLWRLIDFYTDPAVVPEGMRGAEQESLEDQLNAYIGKQLPLTRQSVSYSSYSTPTEYGYNYGSNDYYPGDYYPGGYYPDDYYPGTNYPSNDYPDRNNMTGTVYLPNDPTAGYGTVGYGAPVG